MNEQTFSRNKKDVQVKQLSLLILRITMSWGATAFTPIVTYNTPPFGFAERPNPSDFPTCPEDPYSGADNIKERIKEFSNNQNKEYFNVENDDSPNNENDIEQYKYHCIAIYSLFIIALFFFIYYRPTTN